MDSRDPSPPSPNIRPPYPVKKRSLRARKPRTPTASGPSALVVCSPTSTLSSQYASSSQGKGGAGPADFTATSSQQQRSRQVQSRRKEREKARNASSESGDPLYLSPDTHRKLPGLQRQSISPNSAREHSANDQKLVPNAVHGQQQRRASALATHKKEASELRQILCGAEAVATEQLVVDHEREINRISSLVPDRRARMRFFARVLERLQSYLDGAELASQCCREGIEKYSEAMRQLSSLFVDGNMQSLLKEREAATSMQQSASIAGTMTITSGVPGKEQCFPILNTGMERTIAHRPVYNNTKPPGSWHSSSVQDEPPVHYSALVTTGPLPSRIGSGGWTSGRIQPPPDATVASERGGLESEASGRSTGAKTGEKETESARWSSGIRSARHVQTMTDAAKARSHERRFRHAAEATPNESDLLIWTGVARGDVRLDEAKRDSFSAAEAAKAAANQGAEAIQTGGCETRIVCAATTGNDAGTTTRRDADRGGTSRTPDPAAVGLGDGIATVTTSTTASTRKRAASPGAARKTYQPETVVGDRSPSRHKEARHAGGSGGSDGGSGRDTTAGGRDAPTRTKRAAKGAVATPTPTLKDGPTGGGGRGGREQDSPSPPPDLHWTEYVEFS